MKPGKTEQALTALALLPWGSKTKARITKVRDTIKAVRLLRGLLRGESECP